MSQLLSVTSARTEDLQDDIKVSIVQLCIMAHQEEDFHNLFTYIPSGGLHFLAYFGMDLVSHAVVTPRMLQPEGQPWLRSAYVDAVATLPTYQKQGYGSALMRKLGESLDDFSIGCLETDRVGFYENLGWEIWRGPLAGCRDGKLIATPDQTGIMILRLSQTPTIDLDQGLTIECQGDRIW